MATLDEKTSSAESPLSDDLSITPIELKTRVLSPAPPDSIADDRSSQLSERSVQSNIDNPFTVLSPSDLNDKVAEFVGQAKDLNDYLDILQRGAQLKRDEDFALENDFGLSNDQKICIKHEKDFGFWAQSKFLKGSLLSACLAGIIQQVPPGWTQSAMNGANGGITTDFNIHYKKGDPLRNTGDLWLFGVMNAIPFFAGGLLAPLISDPLQEHWLGRRGAMAVACIISITGTIGQAFSKNAAQLIGCRLMTGLSLAAKASAAPLLTAEIAPDYLRGNLLSTWQLSDAFGIFLGFAANLAVLNVNAEENIIWRIQIALVLIPTLALLLIVYLMPESPRYLMKRGKQSKALESFQFLRPAPVSAILAARDYIYAHFQLEKECVSNKEQRLERNATDPLTGQRYDKWDVEKPREGTLSTPLYDVSRTNYFKRLSQTFQDPPSRRALICASTAMIAQQLTGVNTLAFLSATLLNDRGASDRDGAWVGFGIGLCNFLFGLPSFYLLERVGRATMLLLGFPFMFFLMLILAFGFQIGENSEVRVPFVGVFGILFIIAYSPTAGPAPFAISAEVFPLVVREVGHSIAVAVNFVGLGFVLLFFPPLSDAMGGYTGSLAFFAALNIVAFILCFLFVPETKGRTLEELQFTFDRPTSMHIKYRVRFVMKWYAKKYLRPTAVKLHMWNRDKLQDPGPYVQYHRWERAT